MSSVSLVPRVEQDIKASMDSLQMNFGLDAKVVAEVLGTGIRHLEEFHFLFENEAAIGTWVGKLGLGDATMLQTARLRRAWKATCTYYTQAEQDRSKVALADLDSILADSELRTLKEAFWIRYKLRFPAEVQPSDATVSRISRELSKRMLCIYDVWRVRSLQSQLGTSQKRRKLADGLYTDEPEVDEVVARDVDTYLHKLHTLMIAYAHNGVQVIAGVDPAGEKTLGANSCQFVEVPLDCVLAYYYRARKAAMQVAPAQRLSWLQHRDAEERAEWVSRFREGTRTLGAVIKEVKPTARVMKDGTKLCGDYQKGSCKHAPPCPNGAHRCAVVLRAERVCGAPNHGAAKCKAKAKARRELTPCLVMLHREDITLGRAFQCCGWKVLAADRLTQEADCVWTGLAAPPPISPDSFEQLLQGCASRGAAVVQVELHDRSLPPGHVYVGRGHHSHRLPVTKWCSPYTPGHDCSPSEWMHLFVEHIICNFWTSLPDLQGATLVCDCPLGSLCERDVLAGLVWYQLASSRRGGSWQGMPAPAWSAAWAAFTQIPASVAHVIPYSPQESVITAFRSLFPSSAFRGFVFPFIEDLVNSPPFTLFPQWLREQGLMQRTAEGQGAFGALARGDDPLPTEHPPVLDQDRVSWPPRELRRECVGPLRELKRRWSHVGDHLRKLQTPAVRKVTAQRDLGLLSLFVVLLSWPDTTLPSHLLFGMPAVGTSLPCGVFPQQGFDTIPLHRLFENVESHNKAVQGSIRPGPHDDFLLEQSTKDFEAGFCSAPLSWSELLRHTKGKPIRLIPRCVISQASGKQRVIDNADHGGQSELSSDSNKLVLCSALRPAQHVSLAMRCASPAVARRLLEEDQWEGGGEDWPDAYRHCPMDEDQSRACVVVWYHKDWAQPAYQLYSGLLFGLPLAVTSFNRLSRFSEAVGRRLVCVLVSMYFDDAHLTDPASAKGSAQFAFSEVNKLLGSPFAEAKRQPMSTVGDFLGLEWDFRDVGCHHVVRFWVRSRLQAKVEGLLLQAEQDNSLPPGLASKLYGMLNFLEQGVYGRIGTGGIGALKERQYEAARELTPAIRSSFEVIRAILALRPRRSVEVLPSPCARFVAASDAAEDEPRKGTGGFLLLWPGSEPSREAFVAQVDRHTYDAFLPGEVKIAQLELSMVLFALTARASTFRSRRGTWYIDNVAALMALIRGRSDSPDLERLAHLIHVALFSLQVWVYWEWVPSKSNWSDSISRLGASDPWAASRGFCLHHALFPTEVWSLPLVPAMLVFQFL
ncbi:FCPB [Symbiodinium sp. CCMP2592]|nr:FCPB [Symbiodinium sp. CCMP2592]